MSEKTNTSENQEILGLVSEIYASILLPERFVEVLELWDKNVSNEGETSDRIISILEKQLSSAIPLLENSLREVVNKDELVNRVTSYSRPSILLSSNQVVIGSNAKGNALFNLYDGDRANADFMGKVSKEKFNAILRSAADKNNKKDVFEVISFATQTRDGEIVENLAAVQTVRLSNHDRGYVLIRGLELLLSEGSVEAFKSAFGLTDAEMKIVEALISGLRQKDIAGQQTIREDTVKKHISNIREKTGTPNTIALVCLAASFAQVSSERGKTLKDAKHNETVVCNPSNQTYTMPSQHRLANVRGYKVEYAEFGSKDAAPLLAVHSSGAGFILPPEFVSELVKQGFRVIVPFRPGTGVSDPLKEPFSLQGTARFLLEFADVMKLEKFALLGGTIGFTYAVKIASLQPDRITSLVGIAGYLPIDPAILNKSMARYQRGVLYTLQKSRPLAKFLVLSGYKVFLQLGAQQFLKKVLSKSKADLEVVDSANSIGVLSVGLRIGGAQGVDAFLNDSFLVLHNWSDAIENLNRDVHLIHGDDDSVFSLEAVRGFCRDHPNFKLTELANTGQLMIYARPHQIASMVAQAIKKDQLINSSQGVSQ